MFDKQRHPDLPADDKMWASPAFRFDVKGLVVTCEAVFKFIAATAESIKSDENASRQNAIDSLWICLSADNANLGFDRGLR
jgi:hypothetical protein